MFIKWRLGLFLLVSLVCSPRISARQDDSPTLPDDGKIHLDVVVTPKSGPPVKGLQQEDFILLDNKVPQTITSFRAVDGRQERIEVVVVVDGVNTNPQNVAYEREQIDKFLRTDGGHLAYPTALAVFTDAGTQFQEGFTDGNELSASLEKFTLGLRSLGRSSSVDGFYERLELSHNALREIAVHEGSQPGRKLILWVSPGWPVLSPGFGITITQQRQIIRLRTDLLAPNEELRLGRQTTEVVFGEVKLPDLPNPVWLPKNVEVYMEIDGHKFRNVHRYTNYRRYRVSVKIGEQTPRTLPSPPPHLQWIPALFGRRQTRN